MAVQSEKSECDPGATTVGFENADAQNFQRLWDRAGIADLFRIADDAGGVVSETLVSLGTQQQNRCDERVCAHDQAPLGWDPQVPRNEDDRRLSRRHQQSHPGSEAEGKRVSNNEKSHHDDLPDCQEAGLSANPLEIARNLN